MRRTLNLKLLIVLLIVGALSGGGVYLVHGYQEKRGAGILLSRADKATQKDDLDEAEKYLSRYLILRPDDLDAMARYALLQDKRDGSVRGRSRVITVLEQALNRASGPDDDLRREVRRRVVELLMTPEMGRFKEAREHLQVLLKARPDDGDDERRLATCLEAEGKSGKSSEAADKYRQARSWYEKSVAHTPGQVEGYTRLAGLLRGPLADPGEADRVMDRMISGCAQSPPKTQAEAYLARGRYREENSLPGGPEDVDRARGLAPDDADVLVASANSAEGRGDLDAARKFLDRGAELHPRDARMYRERARLESRGGRAEGAAAALRRGVEALPDQSDLRWMLADLMIRSGKFDEAREAIGLLHKRDDVIQASVDYLDALLLLNQGERAKAVQLFEKTRPVLAADPRLVSMANQIDVMLAQAYQKLGNPERQLAASRRASQGDPNAILPRLDQAAALLALGRADEALEEYRKMAPQVPSARIAVARLLIARNLRLPEGQRRWSEVDQALDEAAREVPDSDEVAILRAGALAERGQPDRARDLLRSARDKQPAHLDLWVALASLAVRRGDPAAALAILDEAGRKLGEGVELRLARANYWAQRGGDAAIKAVQDLEAGADKLGEEDRSRLERGLAEASFRLGDFRRAGRLWEGVLQRHPDDLESAARMLDLALRPGADEDGSFSVKQAVDRLHAIEGEDGSLWRAGQAAHLIALARKGDRRRLDETRGLIAEVSRQRPEWPRVPLLEAELAELEGSEDRALEGYLRAIELGDRLPAVLRRAVDLLIARGRPDEADRLVRKQLEERPATGILGQLGAEMALRGKDPRRALEFADRAVSADSKDYRDFLWLGRLCWAAGQRVKAGEAFANALKLAGGEPETWVAYIDYLAQAEPKDRPPSLKGAKAEEAVREAQRRLPPERAGLVVAHGHVVTGHPDRAEQQYQATLAARPNDSSSLRSAAAFFMSRGDIPKAAELLQKILDPATKAPAGEVAAARRQLAIGLAVRGGYPRLREALALLELNLRDRSDSVEDRRLKALLLGMEPGGQKEAIRVYEEIQRRRPPTPDEKVLLAHLHESTGNWPKARELLLAALADDEKHLAYLGSFARGLLTHGEAAEAGPWLAKLEQLDPRSTTTLELKARLLVAQGRAGEAVNLVKAAARDNPEILGPFASLFEELGQFDAAEGLFRDFAARSKEPDALLGLAAFLGHRGRVSEALDVCDRAWKDRDPEKVGTTSLAVLYSSKADEGQYRRVRDRLEEAIRKRPDSARLMFDLANFHLRRKEYRDAEAIYRKLHERDRSNTGPMNNLAWLLATAEGKGAEALALVNQAIELDGPTPDLLDTRALAHLAMGRGDLATLDLEAAIASRPSPEVSLHLARARLMARDRDGAQAAIRRAKDAGLDPEKLDPLDARDYDRLVAELGRR